MRGPPHVCATALDPKAAQLVLLLGASQQEIPAADVPDLKSTADSSTAQEQQARVATRLFRKVSWLQPKLATTILYAAGHILQCDGSVEASASSSKSARQFFLPEVK